MKANTYTAEFIGTSILTTAVIGSGISAVQLTDNGGLALLINAIATVLTLGLMIALLQPISGAHFNPAVSLIAFVNKQMNLKALLLMVLAQVTGAIFGAVLAKIGRAHVLNPVTSLSRMPSSA